MARVVFGAIALATILASGLASAETKTWLPQQGDSINEDTEPMVTEHGRPRLDRVWVDVDPSQVASPAVNSNKIFVNNCKPNGCIVRSGFASSLDGSGFQGLWQIGGQRTLSAFSQSDTVWNQTLECLRDVFSPFGVEITTTNPSPAAHFEVMLAGHPQDLGMSSGIGGISPFSCSGTGYIPNSLVFAFGNSPIYQNDPEELCSTAAQEIAHSFQLDHVMDPSDPLTYFSYSGRRRFKNAQVQCGSDCNNEGVSPNGSTCTGTTQQQHPCWCGGNTQNSFETITNLFGNGTPTPPTVTIISPTLGANVAPGFPISVEASDNNGIGRVEVFVNNMLTSQLVTGPYAFNAPATLGNGTHTVRVVAFDIYGTSAEDTVQVVIGTPCGKPADCEKDTDTCIGGRCVPGPGAQGGLGSTCNSGPDCASGECASNSAGEKHCVEECKLEAGECPEGFGCLDAGTKGVCWPGYDDGTGGICSAGGPGGAVSLGLAFTAMLFVRRRRKR